MTVMEHNLKTFCIITNREKDRDLAVTKRIATFLEQEGANCYIAEEHIAENGMHYTDATEFPEKPDYAIVLGGDGTLLQAAKDLSECETPILGINLGTLGFLAETEIGDVETALAKLLSGDYHSERHMKLKVGTDFDEIHKEVFGEEEREAIPDALNDVVVTRSGFSRLIRMKVYVNEELVSDYYGDGVILSTPTGSTGYNLSAGGPILSPMSDVMVITPICPHSLTARSIVVSAKDTVAVEILTSKKTQQEEAIATIDGSYAIQLCAGDRIIIGKADRTTELIRFQKESFYRTLQKKLN